MPIHPATVSLAPVHRRTTIRRLRRAGLTISPLRSNEATPVISVRPQHRPGPVLPTAGQAAQDAAAQATVVRAVPVVQAPPIAAPDRQVAVQADLSVAVLEAHVVQELL